MSRDAELVESIEATYTALIGYDKNASVSEHLRTGDIAMWMSTKKPVLGFLALISMFYTCEVLAADQQGESGPIQSIHLRSVEASTSPYWNWIVIAGQSNDQIYYWGGSVCPGKHLRYLGNSDTMVDALAEYATYPDMCITPFFRNGQGGKRCLVMFTAAIRVGDNCGLRPQ